MGSLNYQFLLSLLLIVLGYTGKKLNLVTEKDGEGLSRIVFNFTLPSLILTTFSGMKIDGALILLPLICILFGALMTFMALKVFKKEPEGMRGLLSMVLPGFNLGLFAFPLVEALWGQEGIRHFAMLDMGNAFVIFGLSYILAGSFSPAEKNIDLRVIIRKVFHSLPLLSYIIALVLNLTGIGLPGLVTDITGIISKANAPLSLLLLGIYLSFSFEARYRKPVLKVLACRYLAGLAVGTLLFLLLPFSRLFRYTLLIGFILPIPLAPLPYSVQFGYDSKLTATLINLTIMISFLLIWVMAVLLPSAS